MPKKYKSQTIACPYCGYEYLPGEIFIPVYLIGQPVPKTILRDGIGTILYSEYQKGKELDLEEKYICDHCENTFVVEAQINYKVSKETVELDYTNQYSSLLED